MTKKVLGILTALLFVFLNYSYAQDIIDLNEAVRIGVQNNVNVEAIESSLDIQGFTTESVQGDLFPSLTFTGGWTRNHTFSKGGVIFQNGVPIAIGDQNTTSDNFNLRLNSQLTLFNGFSNFRSVDLNESNYRKLTLDLEYAKREVALNVNFYYFDALKKEQAVLINRDNLADSQAQLERIRAFMDAGRSTLADVYRQEVQVAQNELTLETSINEYNKSKVDLLLSMNVDLDREIGLSASGINANVTVPELQVILAQYSNNEALINKAINNRYDYKAIIQDINTRRIDLDIASRSLYYPTVSAFGDYNLSGSAIDEVTNTRVASYGITISYPIFIGFDLQSNKEIAEVNIRQREEELDYLESRIGAEVRKAVFDLETAYKQAEILDRSIRSAEQDKLLAEENYRVGLGTLLEIQTATTALNNLRIQQSNAIYNFLFAQRQIEYYLGSLTY
jgi:outer membrane protein